MIVADASAVVEALVGPAPDPRLLDALSGDIAAPHLLDVEVVSALRGLVLGRQVTHQVAQRALTDFSDLTITRYEFNSVAARVWQLKDQFTAYDATYIALAEGLDATLITCDRKLARGHSATTTVYASA